jgi:hypothetical protein
MVEDSAEIVKKLLPPTKHPGNDAQHDTASAGVTQQLLVMKN